MKSLDWSFKICEHIPYLESNFSSFCEVYEEGFPTSVPNVGIKRLQALYARLDVENSAQVL